jgi:purine nucleoside permease
MRRTLIALAALLLAPPAAAAPARRPIEVRVVVVTTWEVVVGGKDRFGELSPWEAHWPLTKQLPFAAGTHPLLYDAETHVLAMVTGEATARAAASTMALGLDPRFDLSHAYWLVAGIAGVDPKIGSVGSAAWARFIVDGDLGNEIDPREAPPDWPTGMVPYGRVTPYQPPAPPGQSREANMVYPLNPALADWAFALTKDVKLDDGPALARMRDLYSGPAAKPPFVLEGDGLMSSRFWYGARMNEWAERWVDYWTVGKGVFAMSAEEDSGVMQGLTQLAAAGRVKLDRVLILRTASDYTVGPPGVGAAQFMADEAKSGFPAAPAALSNAYNVGAPVVRYLAEHWTETRDKAPGK